MSRPHVMSTLNGHIFPWRNGLPPFPLPKPPAPSEAVSALPR
jgi:hypothetical protein